MTTVIAAAKREQPEQAALGAVAGVTTPTPSTNPAVRPQPTPAPHVTITSATPGVDPLDFERADRIHVKDGSLFLDGYLVLHPHELAPENEPKLREKMALTYSVNNPSFYESRDRLAVALNLAQILPVSLDAKHSKLSQEISKFNAQVDSGADTDLAKALTDKQHPFAAIVRDTIEKPAKDPVGVETLKNGIGIYLLMRQKLTSLGYRNPLVSYVTHARTPDQVLSDLGEKIGITPLAVRQAALNGGLEGVGQLLGLEPAYVADVKQLVEKASTQEFSLNLIEHWHLGRQLLKNQDASFEQKIATGMEARITARIAEGRARVHNFFDVPDPIKHEEVRIAQALNLVEPIQRALMYKLGYEICYTPEVTADNIAFYNGIYGLHRKAANDLRDTNGTYHIYFSGRGDLKGSLRTLVHEIAHNLWPEQFTAEEVKKIDALATSDDQRLTNMNRLMDEKFPELEKFVKAYQVGSDAEKMAIAAEADAYFKPYGVHMDAHILGYVQNAHDLQFLVKHAYDTLRIEGALYTKSGYDSPHERFREIISRFAELKQVEYASQPQLLNFVVPGLNQVWENEYLPHLQRVYDGLAQGAPAKNTITAQMETSREGLAPAGPMADGVAPKVEQRPAPIAPTQPKPGNGDACMAEGTPDTRVLADSIALNPQTVSAMSALSSMGIQAR